MRIEPKAHFLFLAKQLSLVEAFCRREGPMREGEVLELINLYADGPITIEELRIKSVLEYRSQSDEYAIRYALGEYVREVLNARRMIGNDWTRQQLNLLRYLLGSLETMVGGRRRTRQDWTGVQQQLRDLEREVESIRGALEGNLEVIREQVGEFRKQRPGTSRERFIWISRIWEEHLEPMADVFAPEGEWEKLVVDFERVLEVVDEIAPSDIRDQARWVNLGLSEMVRAAVHTHREGVREVWPIYNSEKQDGALARDASLLLEATRKRTPGWNKLRLDEIFGLEDPWGGERLIKPFDDQILAAKLAEKREHVPAPLPVLEQEVQVQIRMPLAEHEVRQRLKATGGSTEHTLQWLVAAFPEATMKDILRAYGRFVLFHGLEARVRTHEVIEHPEGVIRAEPLALEAKLARPNPLPRPSIPKPCRTSRRSSRSFGAASTSVWKTRSSSGRWRCTTRTSSGSSIPWGFAWSVTGGESSTWWTTRPRPQPSQ